MDAAAKTTQSLADEILPKQPYYLSVSPTKTYPIPTDKTRLDEQENKHLQYMTLVGGEADRGVLITRAYFSVRDEPLVTTKPPLSVTPRLDPNKPMKKISLKDYKKKTTETDTPSRSDERSNGLPAVKEEEVRKRPPEVFAKDMDSQRDIRKPAAQTKREPLRHRSPSPDRRKRLNGTEDGSRNAKRSKTDDAALNGSATRITKEKTPVKPRDLPTTKADTRDGKTLNIANARSASGSTARRVPSPKPNSQVNGYPRDSSNNGRVAHKRAVSSSESVSHAVPELLSPLRISDLNLDLAENTVKGEDKPPRPSPKKKPADFSGSKLQTKKIRPDVEPSHSSTKRKTPIIPPLLSPTLPPVVMAELARLEKQAATPMKESSQTSDSPAGPKNATKSKREEIIFVDNKTRQDEQNKHLVTIKYKKRQAKAIERLLNLPMKKKTEGVKKEDRALHDNTNGESLARKRPRTATDGSEASKRPRTSDALRPTTPPKQSTAMSRIASNSSTAGTPGVAISSTPSIQVTTEKIRQSIDPDKLQEAQKLHARFKFFMGLARQLKHERDAIMKKPSFTDREHQIAVAAGLQSLMLYAYAAKLECDGLDLQQMSRRVGAWSDLVPVCVFVQSDCKKIASLSALLARIKGILNTQVVRAICTAQPDAETARKAIDACREEQTAWRAADTARKKLGDFKGYSINPDGGSHGRFIDRLGPWTSPEELIPIVLEFLRREIRPDGHAWKPHEELAKLEQAELDKLAKPPKERTTTNGVSSAQHHSSTRH